MQSKLIHLGAVCLMLVTWQLRAATLHVDGNSGNPTPPFADWSTAATNIQDAVDAASDGDLILVTNGLYASGGRVVYGSLTNRVAIDKAVTVQSVNGPAVTAIEGYQVPGTINGDSAMRCVYLTNDAALIGFTVTNGATRSLYVSDPIRERSGGGIFCEDGSGWVSNCVVTGNSCFWDGGGTYGGTYDHCQFSGNTNLNFISPGGGGGGAAASTLNHCCLTGNWSGFGGGAFSSTASNCDLTRNIGGGAAACILDNCLISSNQVSNPISRISGGAAGCTLNHCTIANNINTNGNGGGTAGGMLNNCTVSNNWARFGGGVYFGGGLTNAPGQSNVVVGNTAILDGGGVWFNPVIAATNRSLSNWIITSNTAARDGGGVFLFSSPLSYLDHCTFQGNTSGRNGGGLCGPYPGMLTPASNCSFVGNMATANGGGAYSAALNNCSLVGNHAGAGGGVYGTFSNSVANDNTATNGGGIYYYAYAISPLVLANCRLTNNSAINGGGAYGGTFSNCVFWGNSALTNGGGIVTGVSENFTVLNSLVSSNRAAFGGGAYGANMQNCTVSGNQADDGGGCYGGTFTNCSFQGNSATHSGGGIYFGAGGGGPAIATKCIFGNNSAALNGGGVYSGTLASCTFAGNSAGANGGGAYQALLTSCLLATNWAATNGGGTCNSSVANCLLVANSAAYGGGVYGANPLDNSTLALNVATSAGGGVCFPWGGLMNSCIIYDNSAPAGANYANQGGSPPFLNYCCSIPLASGNNSISNDPVFVNLAAGNFRLQTNSPCINAGGGSSSPTDLDGRRRFTFPKPDIGAYEYQGPGFGEFIGWLQQYGLPTDGTADHTDSDGDGMDNFAEWQAGTNPTNALSLLQLAAPGFTNDPAGVVITWQSVTNVTYYLQRSSDLAGAFLSLESNLVGHAGTTSYTDTTATNGGPYFYRVGVP